MTELEIEDITDLMEEILNENFYHLRKEFNECEHREARLLRKQEELDSFFRNCVSSMKDIQDSIKAHALGVQNVYEELLALKKRLDTEYHL